MRPLKVGRSFLSVRPVVHVRWMNEPERVRSSRGERTRLAVPLRHVAGYLVVPLAGLRRSHPDHQFAPAIRERVSQHRMMVRRAELDLHVNIDVWVGVPGSFLSAQLENHLARRISRYAVARLLCAQLVA